jgi:hypothetical protein
VEGLILALVVDDAAIQAARRSTRCSGLLVTDWLTVVATRAPFSSYRPQRLSGGTSGSAQGGKESGDGTDHECRAEPTASGDDWDDHRPGHAGALSKISLFSTYIQPHDATSGE